MKTQEENWETYKSREKAHTHTYTQIHTQFRSESPDSVLFTYVGVPFTI